MIFAAKTEFAHILPGLPRRGKVARVVPDEAPNRIPFFERSEKIFQNIKRFIFITTFHFAKLINKKMPICRLNSESASFSL